jgi:hypothetical protein
MGNRSGPGRISPARIRDKLRGVASSKLRPAELTSRYFLALSDVNKSLIRPIKAPHNDYVSGTKWLFLLAFSV